MMDDTQSKGLLVSVIMPAYNCELYIEAAIRSVMRQTHENWELLVLDDGSTDATCRVVERLLAEDTRIKLLKNPRNIGVANTRNRGLDLCVGDYAAFLDSDDVWHAEKLEYQLNKMIAEGAGLSYTSYAIVDANGDSVKRPYVVPERITFCDLLKENVIGCSTVMLSRDMITKYRFATGFYHEDYCLWLRILQDGRVAAGCREALVDWRLLENSRSFDKRRSAQNRWRIYRDYLRFSRLKSARLFVSYAFNGLKKYYGS